MKIEFDKALELIRGNAGGHINFFMVLLNARGDVLEVPERNSKFDMLIQYLEDQGNIHKVFDISHERLSDIPDGAIFPVRGGLELFPAFETFHTLLPLWKIQFMKLSDDLYAGVLKMADLLPNFYEQLSRGFIYINDDQRLAGFNSHFHDCFRRAYPSPLNMLNRPASEFLSPTPFQFQEKSLAAIPLDLNPVHWEKTVSESSPSLKEVPPHGAFLTLGRAVNPLTEDFRLRIVLKETTDSLPMLILGGPDASEGAPDNHGYLLGLDSVSGRALFKKRSYVTLSRQWRPASGFREADFIKAGNAFMLLLDGKRVFGYFDYDPIVFAEAWLTLYLRSGRSCALKSAELYTRPARAPQEKTDLIVQAGRPDARHFLVIPFTSFTLSAAFLGIHGFYLQDIAKMQGQMDTLRRQYQALVRQDEKLKTELERLKQGDQEFIGTSKPVLKIREQVEQMAGARTTILIQGPTGTGKEVLAKTIHGKSQFAQGPFLKVDCSILPRELMESELFGHEKGAFTGATATKMGLLEQAQNGTVFLDEVNNLTLDSQMKLLHFLQDFRITRVGGKTPIEVNTRILAASNADLRARIAQGAFREDLYYRLAVVTLDLPPLNSRKEDIPALCSHFLKALNSGLGKNIRSISPLAFKKLFEHSWPGNIRELRNSLEQAALFCNGRQIEPEDLRFTAAASPVAAAAGMKRKFVNLEISPDGLVGLFRKNRGNVNSLAAELGVSRHTLYYHFRKLGLQPNRLRENPRKQG